VFGQLPLPGTLAEYVIVPVDRLLVAPPHLTDVEAAALPLAGLTAWRGNLTSAHSYIRMCYRHFVRE